ncbi:hypothetical protein T11_16297 [Trichinella zimbabwensis]|uniref:Uncharacterized protein n=1 Tax=Trichinella zimbabwensis TaxID=268475 RepID=A0A0V1H818_9BILA|nr:hypothetical protein T11_16297 [Trichinella zimbabwensis]
MSSIPVLAIRRECAQITVGLNNVLLQAIQSLKTKSRTSGTTGSYHEAAVSGHAADENKSMSGIQISVSRGTSNHQHTSQLRRCLLKYQPS